MAYITARELRAVVPDQYRDAALADQGGEQPDPGLLAAVIETACQEVDALIEGRVRLPLSTPYPQKIRTAAVYFALEILFTRRGVEMPEATARKIAGIRSDLGKVGAGDLRLEAPVEQTAASRQTSGSIVVRPSITGAGGMIGAILLLLFGLSRPAQAIDARTFSFVAPTNPLFESPDYMEWSQAESVGLRYAVPSADSRDARWEISDATNLWLNMAPTKSGTNWSWNPAPTQTCLAAGRYSGRVALYGRSGTNLVFHRILALQDIRVHAARDPRTLIMASPLATIAEDPVATAQIAALMAAASNAAAIAAAAINAAAQAAIDAAAAAAIASGAAENAANAMSINGGTFTGRVGINSTNPLSWLQIGNYAYPSLEARDNAISVSRWVTNDGVHANAHAFGDSSGITRTGHVGYCSFNAQPTFGGTSAYWHVVGYQSLWNYASLGKLDWSAGFYSKENIESATNQIHYTIFAGVPTTGTGGQINTNYALYIESNDTSMVRFGVWDAGCHTNRLWKLLARAIDASQVSGGDIIITNKILLIAPNGATNELMNDPATGNLVLYANGNTALTIRTNGYIGINGAGHAVYPLHVTGGGYYSTSLRAPVFRDTQGNEVDPNGDSTLSALTVTNALTLANLPQAAGGLASGRIWNDNGSLKVIP